MLWGKVGQLTVRMLGVLFVMSELWSSKSVMLEVVDGSRQPDTRLEMRFDARKRSPCNNPRARSTLARESVRLRCLVPESVRSRCSVL